MPVASPAVNYLTYIQAFCGINWELTDKGRIHGFLSDEERNYMISCAKDLRFGDGSMASLTELFYFLPAYAFHENSEGITEYFSCLAECHKAKNLSPLLNGYGNYISRLQEFNKYFLSDIRALEDEEVLNKIELLSIIYKANYSCYLQLNWDNDRALIEKTCDYINGLFADNDIIGKWEAATGYTLLADQYTLIIVPSLQLGPRANSLHYGVNIFPAISEYCPKQYFDYFIPHEIGTHILKPHTIDKVQVSEDDLRIPYIAFENLAKYINLKILLHRYQYELDEGYYEDTVFEGIYNSLDSMAKDDISAMYFAAIDQYKKSKAVQMRNNDSEGVE